MSIPNLKRIKLSSLQVLDAWLPKQPDQELSIMLVTYTGPTDGKYISRAQLHDRLSAHGWIGGPDTR